MSTLKRKSAWIGLGCSLALTAGSPAIADDTELLLYSIDPSLMPKPNVMFILDTSGSMTTTESTREPYDSVKDYPGNCDPDAVYWTDVDVVPTCDGNNEKYIDDDNFFCDAATNQFSGIGSFTSVMIQYRDGGPDGTGSGPKMWQHLAPGYNSEPVECSADAGIHGDGESSTRLWARNATDVSQEDAWTSDPTEAIVFGSAPRNVNYTFYDGNYLNWNVSPAAVTRSRSEIVKVVAKKVLSSVNDLNVGLMRFNETQGGPVILGLTDLNSNRQAVLDAIDALPADGWTPLSETLYENALYWSGQAAHYGELVDETPTDPLALASTAPEVYQQPVFGQCAQNYNVLLTDGQPTEDADTPGLIDNLPGYATAVGRTGCTGSGEGHCLDDVAEYLFKTDLNPNTTEEEVVSTQTIGFSVDLPILKETAENSGGQYFLADDIESLTKTLLTIIANINDRSLSFSAPAISVNTFNRTQNLNELYLTMFGAQAKVHWPGNLKKYKVTDRAITDANNTAAVDPATGFFYDTSQSFWSAAPDGNDVRKGGAAAQIPDPSVRNLYTNISGPVLTNTANMITPSNGAISAGDLGLTGSPGEPTRDELIRWARGEDLRDEDGNAGTNVRRSMGDPLHSQPAAVVYGGSPGNPDLVVFVATNDGYLHAIDGATGEELWSFIPKELLPNLTRLYFDPNSQFKQYGLDGNIVPVVKDENKNGIVDGNDFVYLIFGMRRGGNLYYALDVTQKYAPRQLWQQTTPSAGQSWSTPVVVKVDINGAGQNSDKAVVLIGGGYDASHDSATHPASADGTGAGISMFDLVSGNLLWRAGRDAGADRQLAAMTRAIPNEIRVIDTGGDGYADRMYASDLGGQIWRFDIINGNPASTLVNGGVIARLGAEGLANPAPADTRRFYNAPDVSLFNDVHHDRRYIAISIGSGYRAHPFDLSASDRFFSLRDKDVFNVLSQTDYDNYPIITEANLKEVSGKKQVVIDTTDRGWMFTLPFSQKVLADSVTFDNSVFFVGFSPVSGNQVNCGTGQGVNFFYRVNVINGDPVVNNLDTLDPADADDARRQTLRQGGIAPTPTVLFPSPDDPNCSGADCTPPPIMCVGVECTDPGFENNPVRTLWTQDGIQ